MKTRTFDFGDTATTTDTFHAFRGCESHQVDAVTGQPLDAEAWYVEPDDYDGDVAYAGPFSTEEEAWDFVEAQIP